MPSTRHNPLPLTAAADGVMPALPHTITAQRCAAVARRVLSSQQLFEGQTEVEIEHGESIYRLRQTSLGKLILTK